MNSNSNKFEKTIIDFFNIYEENSSDDELNVTIKKFSKKLKPLGFVVDYKKLNQIVEEFEYDALATWQAMVDEFVKNPDTAHYIKNPLEYAMRKFQTKEKDEEFLNWALNWNNNYYGDQEHKTNQFYIPEKALLSYTKFFMYRANDEEFKVLPKLFDHAETYGNMPFDIKFHLEFLRRMVLSSEEEQDKFIKERYPYLVKLGFKIDSNDLDYHGSVRTQFRYIMGAIDWKGGIDIPLAEGHQNCNTSILHAAVKKLPASKPLLDFLLKCPDIDINFKSKDKWHYGSPDPLYHENPTSGNTVLHHLARIYSYTHDKFIDDYFDLFVKKGIKLDVVNDRGESVIATAIHHGYAHGVEVCKDLIYPEILHDIAKLDGISEWISINPKIREILYEKYPYMTDKNNMTYPEFLQFIDEQNLSQTSKNTLLNYPQFLDKLIKFDYSISNDLSFLVKWDYEANDRDFEEKELLLRNPWMLAHQIEETIKLNNDFSVKVSFLNDYLYSLMSRDFIKWNDSITKTNPDFISALKILTQNNYNDYIVKNKIEEKIKTTIDDFLKDKRYNLLNNRSRIKPNIWKNYFSKDKDYKYKKIQESLDEYDKEQEKVINLLYNNDRELYLEDYEKFIEDSRKNYSDDELDLPF